MDSLSDLVNKKLPQEPPQVAALKDYVKNNYGESAAVSVNPKFYRIRVASASLAGRLRMDTIQITKECELDRKLVIQIGSV